MKINKTGFGKRIPEKRENEKRNFTSCETPQLLI